MICPFMSMQKHNEKKCKKNECALWFQDSEEEYACCAILAIAQKMVT